MLLLLRIDGASLTFSKSIYVRTDIRIDISISMKHITTKFDKQVYLEVLPQIRLIKQVVVKFRQVHLSWKVL